MKLKAAKACRKVASVAKAKRWNNRGAKKVK